MLLPGSLRPTAFTTNTLTVYVLKGIRFMRVADWRDTSPGKFWDPESPLAENVIVTPVMGLFPLPPFVQLTLSVSVPGEPTITFVGALGGTVVWCVCVYASSTIAVFLSTVYNPSIPAFTHSYTAHDFNKVSLQNTSCTRHCGVCVCVCVCVV